MKKIVFAAIALIALASSTACTSTSFKPSAAILPDVPEYSPATQDKAAQEMKDWCDKMPTICDIFLPDYKLMRDQTRAAKKIIN